jgi:hypothetical protein
VEKGMKKKIIVVAFHLGRIGSSALMGLLKLAGINVGLDEQLIGPKPMNPRGFFELKSQHKFLEWVYKGIYPGITNPPSLELLDKKGEDFYNMYDILIKTDFNRVFPIALKSQRFLTIPFLYRLRHKYDIKILILERNLEEQVNSTLKVWRESGSGSRTNLTREFIADYIKRWRVFGKCVEEFYGFHYFHISFNKLMKHPFKVSRSLFDFISEEPPPKKKITNWLDRSLVNRYIRS